MTGDSIDLRVRTVDAASVGAPLADVGGAGRVVDAAGSAHVEAAAGRGGVAQRMQARLAALEAQARREFPVPGFPDDALRFTVRPVGLEDVAQVGRDVTDARFLAMVTEKVTIVDGGERLDFPSWAGGFAEVMGLPAGTDPEVVVSAVCGGFMLRVAELARRVVEWQTASAGDVEQALGE